MTELADSPNTKRQAREMVGSNRAMTTKDIGSVVEDAVAHLYQNPRWTLAKQQRLPALRDSTTSREIDVLVTGSVAGHRVQIAIECKNYSRRVDIEKMDSFINKLRDVGIPPQYGIFVSVQGFQRGALRRAREEGVRTLLLDGLASNRLAIEVGEAFQSIIYLLLNVVSVEVKSEIETKDGQKLFWFYDDNKQLIGSILDLVWKRWLDRKIPRELGEYEIPLDIPPGWEWCANGTNVPNRAQATVRVTGLVVTERGQAQRLHLRDADTGVLEKAKIDSSFDRELGESKSLPVEQAFTEEELDKLLSKPAVVRISTGRIPLPRIRFRSIYWPPSQKAVNIAGAPFRQRVRGALQRWWLFNIPPDSSILDEPMVELSLEQVEGRSLTSFWDPVMPSHPSARNQHWPYPSQALRRKQAIEGQRRKRILPRTSKPTRRDSNRQVKID